MSYTFWNFFEVFFEFFKWSFFIIFYTNIIIEFWKIFSQKFQRGWCWAVLPWGMKNISKLIQRNFFTVIYLFAHVCIWSWHFSKISKIDSFRNFENFRNFKSIRWKSIRWKSISNSSISGFHFRSLFEIWRIKQNMADKPFVFYLQFGHRFVANKKLHAKIKIWYSKFTHVYKYYLKT